MATKKINVTTIKPEALKTMSNMNASYRNILRINALYRDTIKTVKAEIDEVVKKRSKALEEGKTVDEVTALYPRVELDAKLRKLEDKRTEELKPYMDARKECIGEVEDSLYAAYVYAWTKGNSAVVPKHATVTVGKSVFDVDKSYNQAIKDFAVNLGLGNTNKDASVDKFAKAMLVRISGSVKDNSGDYIKVKNMSSFKEIVLLAFIQYAVSIGSLEETEDYALILKKY